MIVKSDKLVKTNNSILASLLLFIFGVTGAFFIYLSFLSPLVTGLMAVILGFIGVEMVENSIEYIYKINKGVKNG